MTSLVAQEVNITDLTGLETATNLKTLWLNQNSIADISAVAGLTHLTQLLLEGNAISDISPVEGLTHLTTLWLGDNTISDISAVAGLTNLTDLGLHGNSISNISPVAGLTNLTHLWLGNNTISDISAVARLTNLTWLLLQQNSISDISPVAGLTNLTVLSLDGNDISNISPVASLTNLTLLRLYDNTISDISPLVENTGLGQGDEVDLRANPLNAAAINTHIPALQSRGVEVLFSVVATEGVHIPDPNLRAKIEEALGKPSGATITITEMETLDFLDAQTSNITDLTGLEAATKLTILWLGKNNISDISPVASLTNLTHLALAVNSISDISAVAGLTNLTRLGLGKNSISDISAVSGLTNLIWLWLENNTISDISAVAGLTNLADLELDNNTISDISPLVENTGLGQGDEVDLRANPLNSAAINTHILALQSRGVEVLFDAVVTEGVHIPDPNLRAAIETGLGKVSGAPITAADMARLAFLDARNANITDLTGLEHATKLTSLWLSENSIADISPLNGLTNLTELILNENSIVDISPLNGLNNLTLLWLNENSIADISPLAGLTNLTSLVLSENSIADISPLNGLTNLTGLDLGDNPIADISTLDGLTNLTSLDLRRTSISDISPLVANTGLGSGDAVDVSENPLNDAAVNTHIPALQSRGVLVFFANLKPTTSEYLLSIPAGISLIHVPLKVTEVDGVTKAIESISNLYDALGGPSKVNFLITYDSEVQEWRSYFGASEAGTLADRTLTEDMGIIAGMKAPTSVQLRGEALGTNGSSTITLNQGLNLVGLPLNDSRIKRVSNLFELDGIGGNVPVIILTDGGEFKAVGRAGDPGDIAIAGGQAFIMTASRAATVDISGTAWTNDSGTAAAPPVTLKGIEVGDTTPILGLRGSIVDEGTGFNNAGFRVTVKNLSTRSAVSTVTSPDEAGYRSTVVDIETDRAAAVGDVLEISAQSPNPFIGVEPLRYTITAEDVKQSLVQLPELVAYEIPAETQLLANYPNPFNPETWIPYRLAEDAFVTLTIYDGTGQIVRTINVGHQVAAVYESRSKAIYWDGRNGLGEQVASGVYFYHLSAGDYSATRKMLILK